MRARLLALSALVLVLPLVATGCSKSDGTHWRKANDNNPFLLFVHVPATSIDPAIGSNNRTPAFVAGVNHAIFQWDAHPDVAVIRLQNTTPCASHSTTPNAGNCISAYRVTEPFIEAQTGFDGTVGAAWWWTDGEHIFNSGADPNRATWTRYMVLDTVEAESYYLNIHCHELGHDFGLNHADPWDLDGDGTKETQPQGPCQDGVPDQSESYRDGGAPESGYDFDNVEIEYDTCHSDGPASNTPPGAGFGLPGDDVPCSAPPGRPEPGGEPEPFGGGEAPSLQKSSDTAEVFEPSA